MPSGRNSKKRQRAERQEAVRKESVRKESSAAAPAPHPGPLPGVPRRGREEVDPTDLFSRLGLRWTGLAGVLIAFLFFWTWLFLEFDESRGTIWWLIVSPELWIGYWFGNLGSGSPPSGFFDRMPVVMTAGLIVLASFGPGSLLVTLLTKRGSLDRLEQVVLGIGAGLNLASLGILAGGMSMPGALHDPWWIWFGLLVGLLLLPGAIWIIFFRQQPAPASAEQTPATNDVGETKSIDFTHWGGWFIAVLSVPYLLGGMLPPSDFDVREYHLQAPKEWMQRGQIEFLPHNVYANMPLGAEAHALTATAILGSGDEAWWLGGLTGKLLISLFGPLTALLLWCIGRRSGYATAGLLAAVCYLSLPWVAHVSMNGLNDAVLGFYLVAAWWVWLRSEAGDWRALVLAGFFVGAGAAVKYPAMIFGVLPLFVETLLRRLGLRGAKRVEYVGLRQLGSAATGVVLLTIGLAAGGGLWYVKNKIQTGNPVYPLLVSRLGGETRTPEKDARWVKAHAVPQENGSRFSLSQFVAGLTDLAFRNRYASPVLIPLALLGCVFAFRRWWTEPASANSLARFPLLAIGLFAFSYGAWYLLTHRIDRFLVPTLPLLALLAGYGYAYVKEQAGATVARAFVIVGLVYCWMSIAGTFLTADIRWFVALAHLRADPIAETRPGQVVMLPPRLKPAERWLNDHLTGDDGVLMVGGAEVWDLNGKTKAVNVYYNTCFDDCVLFDWRAGKKTAEDFRGEFTARKVKYVCVDWEELARYKSDGNYGYDRRFSVADSLNLFQNFEKVRLLKHEIQFGEVSDIWKVNGAPVFTEKPKRPKQVIYRVLTSAEAAAAAATERERQKAAKKNIKPTPKAAPPASANQSRQSDERKGTKD